MRYEYVYVGKIEADIFAFNVWDPFFFVIIFYPFVFFVIYLHNVLSLCLWSLSEMCIILKIVKNNVTLVYFMNTVKYLGFERFVATKTFP